MFEGGQRTLLCRYHRAERQNFSVGLIASNLVNLRRRLEQPRDIGNWSPTSLQQRVVKTGVGHEALN